MAIYMEMRFPYIVPWGNLKQSSQVHTFLHSVKASFFKNKFTFLFYTVFILTMKQDYNTVLVLYGIAVCTLKSIKCMFENREEAREMNCCNVTALSAFTFSFLSFAIQMSCNTTHRLAWSQIICLVLLV